MVFTFHNESHFSERARWIRHYENLFRKNIISKESWKRIKNANTILTFTCNFPFCWYTARWTRFLFLNEFIQQHDPNSFLIVAYIVQIFLLAFNSSLHVEASSKFSPPENRTHLLSSFANKLNYWKYAYYNWSLIIGFLVIASRSTTEQTRQGQRGAPW